MSFWTAIVIIVAIGCGTGVYAIRSDMRSRRYRYGQFESGITDKWEERIEKLERRMANIETIILDREKASRFDNLG